VRKVLFISADQWRGECLSSLGHPCVRTPHLDSLARQGTTVLVTTHYLDEAERCDRVAIIHGGRMAALGTTAELKQGFADRPIIEVRSDQPVKAMAALDAWPGVEKTSLFGTAVHAVLRDHDATESAVASVLAAAGLPSVQVSRVSPSLEDVFLDVVDRLETAGAA